MTTTAPPISSLPEGTVRPRWSVMIPTFNCANYLRDTLASVLAQAPGPEDMQIEVIDDCSTKDDPAAVVRALSPNGRVVFYRQPANGGAIANFNTCIARSRGHLVHILHGDDTVEPDFYRHMSELAELHPRTGLFACRALIIDQQDAVTSVSADYQSEGLQTDATLLWYENPITTPTVVVRRSFYETQGGFNPSYPHVADWDMWWRAVQAGGLVLSRRPLARYRVHAGNDTSRLARTAENLEDYLRLAQKIAATEPGYDARELRSRLSERALGQALSFSRLDQKEAELANRRFFWRMTGGTAGCIIRFRHALDRRLQRLAAAVMPDSLGPSR
ncbi:MAG: glycosyl transferase family 2 [Rariglobus sp.]|nr:glycosyl transferase family 2 [Rariglobus sp.]